MTERLSRNWCSRAILAALGAMALVPLANAQTMKAPSQVRENDFPSVRGYDPGYAIPYDPKDPYVALEYINEQFEGVWADIDGGVIDGIKYFSRAPLDEDYSDSHRPHPTPNTPKLTPVAAEIFRTMRTRILAGDNPAQAAGWCFITHAPTTSFWNQFMFTPDSMNASIPGGGGSIYVHVYMDGRPHPEHLILSETGHQVGHWEGDTLVIDGVGYVGDRDLEIGLLSTDQQHVITKYRRTKPDLLEAEYTVIDPKIFTAPWVVKRRWRRSTYDINLLRDPQHCVSNANLPDMATGGNQLATPDGKKLQKVPTD